MAARVSFLERWGREHDCLSPILVTEPNFVSVNQTVWVYVGNPKHTRSSQWLLSLNSILQRATIFAWYLFKFLLSNFNSDSMLKSVVHSKHDAVKNVWLSFGNYMAAYG